MLWNLWWCIQAKLPTDRYRKIIKRSYSLAVVKQCQHTICILTRNGHNCWLLLNTRQRIAWEKIVCQLCCFQFSSTASLSFINIDLLANREVHLTSTQCRTDNSLNTSVRFKDHLVGIKTALIWLTEYADITPQVTWHHVIWSVSKRRPYWIVWDWWQTSPTHRTRPTCGCCWIMGGSVCAGGRWLGLVMMGLTVSQSLGLGDPRTGRWAASTLQIMVFEVITRRPAGWLYRPLMCVKLV